MLVIQVIPVFPVIPAVILKEFVYSTRKAIVLFQKGKPSSSLSIMLSKHSVLNHHPVPATVQEAIKIVKDNVNQATNLKASVDGKNIKVDSKLRSLTRIFEFTLPADNIFGTAVLWVLTRLYLTDTGWD